MKIALGGTGAFATKHLEGIANIDDVMEFFVAGATAVQIGTANYYDPTVSMKVLDRLADALAEADASCVADVAGSLRVETGRSAPTHGKAAAT